MFWFYLAVAATFIFAAQELLMRVLSIRTDNPRLFSVAYNTWGAAFAILLFVVQRGTLSALLTLRMPQILLIAASAAMYGLYERYQFNARRGMDAATFAIVMRLQTVIAFFGAILFLGESLTLVKFSGVLLIVVATMLLIYRNPKFSFTPAFWYAMVCSIMLGATGFTDKPASVALPASLYSFLMWTLPLGIIAFPGIQVKQLKKEFRNGGWHIAIAAILNVVGYIIYIRALGLAEASRVNPIVATNSVITVLGGIYLLHERDHFRRKLLAGIIAFAGVILLK